MSLRIRANWSPSWPTKAHLYKELVAYFWLERSTCSAKTARSNLFSGG